MPISFFGWFVQYPNVGHKIYLLNEKMMMTQNKELKNNNNNSDK
jgi:hypothetical protein